MHTRRIAALALAAFGTMILTTFGVQASAAQPAHWVYEQGWVWQSDDVHYCLRNRSSVTADDASSDKTATSVSTYESFLDIVCDSGQVNWSRTAGNLAAITYLYIWAGTKHGWVACMHLPFAYNPVTASKFEQDKTWADANILNCFKAYGILHPRGYLASFGGTFVKDYGGTWRPDGSQAYIWSGAHAYNRG